MKDTDYVMNIMEIWMPLDELEGAKTRKDFMCNRGMKETKLFTYRKPCGINFKYRNQLYDHKNQRHAPIYLLMTWETKFWNDHNFALHVDMSEVNTALVPGHFQNDGVVQQSLYFWRALAM